MTGNNRTGGPSSIPYPEESRRIAVLASEISGGGTDVERRLLFSELGNCISLCGGSTAESGNGMLFGFFGTGRSAELAPVRAVDCGLRIMKTIAMVNRSVTTSNGKPVFTGRTGIVWREASIDTGGARLPVNAEGVMSEAADLLSGAEPGMLVVSDEIRASCGGYCGWRKLDTGWEPVPGAGRVVSHPLLARVPLVGRKREMDHLSSALSSWRKWHCHPPVMVTGKPGTGKTRLIDEFLGSSAGPSVNVVRLSNRLWDQPPLGMWNPLMERGSFDPYGTVMSQVRKLSSRGELIISIEDLHWADDASKKLLEQIFQSLCDSGAFLILSSRSLPGGTLESRSEKLTVDGLQPEAVEELVGSILGRPSGGEGARFTEFLMESTAGNPLLVMELVLHVMENGAVGRNRSGHWFIREEPDNVIPLSAESLLQARLGALDTGERYALQVASALGAGFTMEEFQGVHSRLGGENHGIMLSRLMNTGFLRSSSGSSFSFTSSIMAETVYRTITPGNRRMIHRTAAGLLSGLARDRRTGTGAIAIARHWMESDSDESALPWLMEALSQCLDMGDAVRAESISRVLHERMGEESTELKLLDARLHLTMGRFRVAHESLEVIRDSLKGAKLAQALFLSAQATENLGLPLREAIDLYELSAQKAAAAGDHGMEAQALSSAGSLYLATGDRKGGLSAFSRALEHRDALDTPSLARLHGNMGILMHRTGSHDEALSHYSRTLELGRKCGSLSIEANALAFMGQVEINMGQRESGLQRYRDALAIHRKAGNRRGECITLGNLGGQLARFGEIQEAIETLRTAIEIAEETGHTRGIMSFHSNLGLALKSAGRLEEAEMHERKALEMIARSGDRRAMAVAHLNLSTVLSRMNRLGEAMEESRRALRYSCSVNALTTQARALGNLGWLMIRTDRSDMAVNFFREAHRRSYLAEDHSMLAACRTGEGRALLELGRMSEARECLKEATELGEAYGMDHETREDYEAFRASMEGTGDGQGS